MTNAQVQSFRFAARRPVWWLLAPLGIRPSTAWLAVTEDELVVRFGPWRLRTTRDNIRDVRRTGPYHWWRVLGPHLSLADRGVTFGTNTGPGVCVCFVRPVPALLPGRRLRHPGLTVTVSAPDTLVAALSPHAS